MIKQMWVIFLLMTSAITAQSQIVDDFSSAIGQLNDLWLGDRALYLINVDDQLQLSDNGSGTATIYQATTWQEDMSWEIFFSMDFNPSNSNRLELYLYNDNEVLEDGNGLLLRLGETGNQDAIELIRQSDGKRDVLASGTMGLVAEGPVTIRLIATIDQGFLSIRVDDGGGVCFEPEIETPATLLSIGTSFFFGWSAIYTSTRSDKFIFDDIYVGERRLDTRPPSITSLSANATSINLIFSEVMDPSSFDNSTIGLSPSNNNFNIEVSKGSAELLLSEELDNETIYELSINGLSDLAGNELDTVITFRFPGKPTLGSLLINEVLFNPKGSGVDYIEIVNQTNRLLDLSEVVLSNTQNGRSVDLIGVPFFEAGAFLVLTSDPQDVILNYPSNDPLAIRSVSIPSLNNDDGNITLTIGALVIDAFDYDESYHQPFIDDVDGISLERISLTGPTNDPSNWSSAAQPVGFGTPGLANSINGTEASEIINVELSSKIFSPNSDGDKDVVDIIYEVDNSGYLGTVTIYNDRGQLIKNLSNNEILGLRGVITWDGTGNDNDASKIGVYIIHVSLFNIEGTRFEKKLTVGLGDFLN